MSFSPIQKNERIQLLDILRGFAILGIFIMNLESFTMYWMLTDAEKQGVIMAAYDHKVEFLQYMLLEGKFYSIFSLLFGIGFAIYLSKADKNIEILGLFRRRLAILFLIGFIHLLFWTGDIVAFYAIIGFCLIPFRRFSNRTLLIIAVFCILSPIGWYTLKMSYPDKLDLSRFVYRQGEHYAGKIGITSVKDLREVMLDDNFFQFIKTNLVAIFFRYGDLIYQSRFFKVLGMFLVGLVVGRSQLIRQMEEKRRLLTYVMVGGFIIGLPANYVLATLKQHGHGDDYFMHGLKQSIAYALGVAPLALAYSSAIALLYLGGIRKLLALMAPAGRMALTNYILHSVIGLLLFTGLGFKFPPLGPAAWTILALAVFLVQVFLSWLWLRVFQYGPIEWLWRSATYGKWQTLRKKAVL